MRLSKRLYKHPEPKVYASWGSIIEHYIRGDTASSVKLHRLTTLYAAGNRWGRTVYIPTIHDEITAQEGPSVIHVDAETTQASVRRNQPQSVVYWTSNGTADSW